MQMNFSDEKSKFLRVFNFAIVGYLRNLQKLDVRAKIGCARKISVLQYHMQYLYDKVNIICTNTLCWCTSL